jgi:hypothetical protein
VNADIKPVRRRNLAMLLATTLRHPLAGLATLLGTLSLPFGLARSRRSVLRNGWILGDKDR